MGCKAEGAAQGYTILGGIVLLVYAFQRILGGVNNINNPNSIIEIILGIAVIIIVILAFDASGMVTWMVKRSGILLALFGLFLILIVSGLSLDILAWISGLPSLAGFMILLAGILTLWSK